MCHKETLLTRRSTTLQQDRVNVLIVSRKNLSENRLSFEFFLVACNNAAIIYSGTDASFAAENASLEQWEKTLQIDLTASNVLCFIGECLKIHREYFCAVKQKPSG